MDDPLDLALREIRSYLVRCPKAAPSTIQRYVEAVCREHKLSIEGIRQHIVANLKNQEKPLYREALERVEGAFAQPAA